MSGNPVRNRMIAKIKIAQKQLGLDEEAYRDALQSSTGKRSAADCTEAELERALAGFGRLGFRTVTKTKTAGGKARKPYVAKIYALWGDLERTGSLVDPSLAALSSFIKRQTGLDRAEWLGPEEANKVTEGLKAWLGRVRKGKVA